MKKKIESVQELPPYDSHRNKMAAFFGKDNDVTVTLTVDRNKKQDTPIFNIIVAGCEHKAEAMRILLNGSFKLGNYNCKLLVNGKGKTHKTIVTPAIIQAAFSGNSLFSDLFIKYNDDGTIDKWSIQMEPVTVCFPNDQLNSPNGMECHSAEDLARMVLTGKHASVLMFCTDAGDYNGYWDNPEFGSDEEED